MAMKRSVRSLHRSSPNQTEPFMKFLKPGALARMRDYQISARSHRIFPSQNRTSPPSSPPSTPGQPQVNATDGFPYLSPRVYGPLCHRRKKFMAAKCIIFQSKPVELSI